MIARAVKAKTASQSLRKKNKELEEDTEPDRANAIKLEQPFYEVDENQKIDIERTASFGEGVDLLK